jgi:exopolyphosphatase/guanosine-5'-triphosphate,3'-diphosphate pyrophosphatase
VSEPIQEPSSDGVHRFAAIDVGTNSIRLTVAEVGSNGRYRILDDEKETTRLGQGLASDRAMRPEAMEKSALAIARMKKIAEGYGVEALRAIGTCAIREAENRDAFLDMVHSQAGLAIEPIDAEMEAEFAHLSVANAFDLHGVAAAVVDIGGGSTEVVLSAQNMVEQVYSLPLGAVRLTEAFGGPEQAAGVNYKKMRRAVRDMIEQEMKKLPFVPQLMIGTGGTFTTLANIAMVHDPVGGAGNAVRTTVRGYELNRSRVRHLADWLRDMPWRDRPRVQGLSAERADIIVAGLTIVERVMKHLQVNRLQVHDGGVRDGLLRTMADDWFRQSGRSAPEAPDPLKSVRDFARACHYEERHCNHVAYLAGLIFDQLAACLHPPAGSWADPANRVVLEAAAMLHDVGYFISYSKHHQHSYHLIAHSDLAGFSPLQTELVANVARYHCGAYPNKRKHAPFAKLAKPNRQLVRHLAAILRIASGLDRSHLQHVRDLALRLEDDRLHFVLQAAQDPAVDIWQAEHSSELFRRTFDLKPRFEWSGPTNPEPGREELLSETPGR